MYKASKSEQANARFVFEINFKRIRRFLLHLLFMIHENARRLSFLNLLACNWIVVDDVVKRKAKFLYTQYKTVSENYYSVQSFYCGSLFNFTDEFVWFNVALGIVAIRFVFFFFLFFVLPYKNFFPFGASVRTNILYAIKLKRALVLEFRVWEWDQSEFKENLRTKYEYSLSTHFLFIRIGVYFFCDPS